VADNTKTKASDNPCLKAALALATHSQRPVFVFPCPPGEKKSYYSKKYDPDDQEWGATTNPDRIRKYWKLKPNANVCIPTGLINDVFVIETDTKEGHPKNTVEGEETWGELVKRHGGVDPVTLMARSPTIRSTVTSNFLTATISPSSAAAARPASAKASTLKAMVAWFWCRHLSGH
jgi:hypothetical protein